MNVDAQTFANLFDFEGELVTQTDIIDAGANGEPLGGWSNQAGTDCNDEDPDEFPGQTWYADCDGDSIFGAEDGIVACGMAEALNDMEFCAGNGNGNLPFDVSTTAPVTPDCDDFDPSVYVIEDWYPDCDDFDARVQDLDCSGVCGGEDISCLPFFLDGFELSSILGMAWRIQSDILGRRP